MSPSPQLSIGKCLDGGCGERACATWEHACPPGTRPPHPIVPVRSPPGQTSGPPFQNRMSCPPVSGRPSLRCIELPRAPSDVYIHPLKRLDWIPHTAHFPTTCVPLCCPQYILSPAIATLEAGHLNCSSCLFLLPTVLSIVPKSAIQSVKYERSRSSAEIRQNSDLLYFRLRVSAAVPRPCNFRRLCHASPYACWAEARRPRG
jgi:hypothetical protein